MMWDPIRLIAGNCRQASRPLGGRPSRREVLRLGTWATLTAGLPSALLRAGESGSASPEAAENLAAAFPGFGRAKAVILVFANGGQSQIDTWDPKPDAPAEVRGAFQPIATRTPGIAICEHLPKVAAVADRCTIVRSMSHDDLDHGSAAYLALTGHFHPRKSSNPPPRPEDFPTYGAVLQRVRPNQRFPYTAVHLNAPAIVPERISPGQFGGFLGSDYDPLAIEDVAAGAVALPSLDPRPELPQIRLQARQRLLESLDDALGSWEGHQGPAASRSLYRQAFEVLASPRCRQAFDLSQEPERLRERYGRYRSGQACLLARRLVEAGVPWTTVIFNHTNRGQDHDPNNTEVYGWDTHNDIFTSLREHLLPRFDQSFSALLTDLEERGLLETTLVVAMGEFGRAPVVALEPRFAGSSPGRKHWASAYSIVMAGAGIQPGAVYGRSDRLGGHVTEGLLDPTDIAATLFAALGINPAQHYQDSLGRPFAVATGKPVAGLYGTV